MLGDGAGTEEAIVSRFTENMFRNAHQSTRGMVTGEPHEPVRQTWLEVHERARRVAGGLAAAGVGHGGAVGAAEPFLIAIPVLEEKGIKVIKIGDLLESEPIDPVETDEDDLALMQL